MGYFYHNDLYDNEGKKEKEKEEREERAREGEAKRKAKSLRSSLLDHDSSVEVGYGLCYFIVNSK